MPPNAIQSTQYDGCPRFEEYCGVFRPDIRRHYNKPVQHTVHTRVSSILDWINMFIEVTR